MSRSARLVVRVVLVPAGAIAADARRRVADLLLRAATTAAAASDPPISDPQPGSPPGEKAA